MTYLATEMLLYLASAALIGLGLGWLIRGGGQRRKLQALRSDLMATIEAEREAHQGTRLELDEADKKLRSAVEQAKADASRSIAELRQTVDSERLQAREAQATIETMRAELENAIQEGRSSGQEAVDQAMHAANAEKAAAAEAMAREAQSRAQIEELRLLIGAEKLAAESARAELEKVRADMQAKLETERAAYEQAKVALDDIRSTLAKTLGPSALELTEGSGVPTASSSLSVEQASGVDEPSKPYFDKQPSSPFSMMTDIAAAGEALNNPDLDEADIEDREDMSLDLLSTIDTEAAPEPAAPDLESDKQIEIVDPTPSPVTDRIELRPHPTEPTRTERPATFLDRRPDVVDDLQSIDGISPEIERRLQASGCYRYRQLAELSPKDIEWLAREIDVPTFQMAADRWVEQAKTFLRETETANGPVYSDQTDRTNVTG